MTQIPAEMASLTVGLIARDLMARGVPKVSAYRQSRAFRCGRRVKPVSWPTPRDLIQIDPNPARISVSEIVERFGVSEKVARDLRALASRAPEVLARHRPKKRARS